MLPKSKFEKPIESFRIRFVDSTGETCFTLTRPTEAAARACVHSIFGKAGYGWRATASIFGDTDKWGTLRDMAVCDQDGTAVFVNLPTRVLR